MEINCVKVVGVTQIDNKFDNKYIYQEQIAYDQKNVINTFQLSIKHWKICQGKFS